MNATDVRGTPRSRTRRRRSASTMPGLTGQPDVAAVRAGDRDLPEEAAVQVEQVHSWEYIGMDYPAQTAYMTKLAQWMTESEDVTV
jgi:hypothetical protein